MLRLPHGRASARALPVRASARAFTLIEMLVVIAVIAVLAAMLFPVFAQAREKARQTVCLSNERQIGMAFMLYANDADEQYPLASQPATPTSWTASLQPYVKSRQVFRCPDDASRNWDAPLASPNSQQQGLRVTSYFSNLWLDSRRKFGTPAALSSPANVIYVSESAENLTRDSFFPMYWNLADPENPSGMMTPYMHNLFWDAAKNQTTELALARHSEGCNHVYADGHAKWGRWTQLWFQDVPHSVYEGAFDPRQ